MACRGVGALTLLGVDSNSPECDSLSLFEGGSHCCHYPTIVWPQAKLQGGNTAPPISRKLDKDLLSKAFHNSDNYDGVMTHLEPDILECEVKWALGRITTDKASGGNGIPVEIFQILKDDAV